MKNTCIEGYVTSPINLCDLDIKQSNRFINAGILAFEHRLSFEFWTVHDTLYFVGVMPAINTIR